MIVLAPDAGLAALENDPAVANDEEAANVVLAGVERLVQFQQLSGRQCNVDRRRRGEILAYGFLATSVACAHEAGVAKQREDCRWRRGASVGHQRAVGQR